MTLRRDRPDRASRPAEQGVGWARWRLQGAATAGATRQRRLTIPWLTAVTGGKQTRPFGEETARQGRLGEPSLPVACRGAQLAEHFAELLELVAVAGPLASTLGLDGALVVSFGTLHEFALGLGGNGAWRLACAHRRHRAGSSGSHRRIRRRGSAGCLVRRRNGRWPLCEQPCEIGGVDGFLGRRLFTVSWED